MNEKERKLLADAGHMHEFRKDEILVIHTKGGQIAVRADDIAFFLRDDESGAVDIMLRNGHSAQLGIVDIDTFKQVAEAWNQALLNI